MIAKVGALFTAEQKESGFFLDKIDIGVYNKNDISVENGDIDMISKKERTRESILDTAYELFARDGFNKVTMKDICEATGMSRGGLYSHFGSTRELFEAILEKINQKDEMNFQKEIEDGMSATDILDRALVLMRSSPAFLACT